ncbi:MAG: hypothetical protein HWE34_01610, partial [Methylocystaceae bacterium]|nr:hypothetical protein [Methylocystaceae bacterium]
MADKLGVDQGYCQRRADIRKHIKELEKQLDTVETSLADLETDVCTNKIDTVIFERVKTNLACQREDLLEKIEQASIRYECLGHDVQWLSALSNLTLDTERFGKNFSDRKKKDWLYRIVERIDVNYLHEMQEDEVNLRLKIPLFSDNFLGIETHKSDDFIKFYPLTNHSTVVGLPSFGVVSGDILDNSANEIKNRVYTKAIIKV